MPVAFARHPMTGAANRGPLLFLDDVRAEDRAAVGGKAFALARLRAAGLPVPDGFVIPADLDLERSRAAIAAACARLGFPVAVRSSAAGEDAEAASFAGQYATELDLTGEAAVMAAVQRCRAAVRGAEGYAAVMGAVAAAPALLVQRFVEPRAAGVVFTRDPRDPARMVVESHAGRGEALVGGQVTPARHLVPRDGAPRGSVSAETDGAGGGSLAPFDLAAVAALARQAEALLGAPQDVEWAIGPAGVVLLQSRPITVEADAAPVGARRLTRANVGEVLPDPVTPLTRSTVIAFLEHGFGAVAARAGLLPPGGGPFLVVHGERLYLNLTLALDIAQRLPGITRDDAERLVLGGAAGAKGHAKGPPRLPARAWTFLLPVAARLASMGRRLDADVAQCGAAVAALAAGEAADDAAWDRLLRVGREVSTTHIAASGASAVRLAVLARVVARLAPGDATDRVNRLTAGLDGVESAAPAAALEAIAEEASRRPEWREFLAQDPARAALRLRDGDGPRELAAAMGDVLQRFGHRGVSEGELFAPSWADDPTPVLQSLQALMAAGSPGLGRRHAAARRLADEEALLARAPLPVRGAVRQAIAGAQAGVRLREKTKSLAIRVVAHGRRLARQAGARLVAAGALAREDDVFFLTEGELRAALAGAPVPLPALARRRRRYERARTVPAPREIDLDEPATSSISGGALRAMATDGALATPPETPHRCADADAGPSPEINHPMHGIGVSTGIGIGPARIAQVGAIPSLRAGEVLVAPVLDAAFGPLLAAAAGAVAEIGGLLSHGAVVARELGVPCVVDVRGATRRIRDGDIVRVDGATGRVEVLPPAASPAAPVPPRWRRASDDAEETFHPLEDHPSARESIYLNVQDPASGLTLVASLGVRAGNRGEALLALCVAPDRVLFGLERAAAATTARAMAVGPARVALGPVRLSWTGRLSEHDAGAFPPGPLPLLLAPPVVPVVVDLTFTPTTPALDFCADLPDDVRAALTPLGAHHIEQSGTWTGVATIDGRAVAVAGTGSRDHTRGRRQWAAAEWWRLFTVRFGDDLAVHGLVVSARGRVVEGGFIWREGRLLRVSRVRYAPDRDGKRIRGVTVEMVAEDGPAVRMLGRVHRTITVPVDPDRRVLSHLAGRPWALVLHENFTRYETDDGRVGHGMFEVTER